MVELFSEMPLFYLEERQHEIERFKSTMFPEIEGILNDMGCSGSVDFKSTGATPVGYDTVVIKAKKPGTTPMEATVEVKFPSANPTKRYAIQWKDGSGEAIDSTQVGTAIDAVDVIESYLSTAFGNVLENKGNEDYEEDNVKDAKECKAALDKLIVGSDKLKGYGLETVLTEDVSVGAEMPIARVELGIRADKSAEPYYKAGDLLEYYTFDFSGGMCHITFHLQEEDWDEMLSDHPSVTAMIEDLAPDMIDELENHDFVNRPGEEN